MEKLIAPKINKLSFRCDFFLSFSLYYIASVCMCVCMCTYARAHLWRSEDKLQELVLSFGHVGPRGQTLVISLDGSLLHLLSHLDGPLLCVHVCMRVQRWVEVCVCVQAGTFTGVFKSMYWSKVNTESSSITIYFTHWDKSLKKHKTQNPQNSYTQPLWLASFLQRFPVSPSGHCEAWVLEIQIQSSLMEPSLLSPFRTHVNMSRHCVCECPHTHVFHGTRGQTQAVFFGYHPPCFLRQSFSHIWNLPTSLASD